MNATDLANARKVTHRGFTHHEHLDNLAGLVHANGRVLDSVTGRFLSLDPMFQAPTNTQSVNPYSYVMNNPLSLADPSGYNACMVGDLCMSGGEHDRDSKGNLLASDAKQMMNLANGVTAHIGSFVASKDDDGNLAFASDNGAKTTQSSDDSQLVAKTGTDVNSPASLANAPSGGDNKIDVTATDVRGGSSVEVQQVGGKDGLPMPISDRNKEGGYGTPTEAALAQFHAYKPEYDQSVKGSYELTGLIYGNGSRDFFSIMVRVPTAFNGNFATPTGYDVVGLSHTHPDNSTFGGYDYISPAKNKVPSFMMNSDYNVFKWNPGRDGNSNGAYEYGRSIGWMPGMSNPPLGQPNTPFNWGITPVGNANSGGSP
jgi:RHS repeat-associated protein